MAALRPLWVMLCLMLALAGCATTGVQPAASAAKRVGDPLETLNRQVSDFNTAIDDALMLPIARAWDRYVPDVFQMITRNVLSNLLDPWVAFNNLLQGKPADAFTDVARFGVNTTFGFAGFMDVASELGLEKHREDFGQTLAVWGVPSGPYVVLPILGPSTVRDTAGFGVDVFGALVNRFDRVALRNSIAALEFVQTRAKLLPAQQALEGALDRYLLMRDSYLQRRRSQFFDGLPPDFED
jgi:phospholipid-binding lipoprotein MlaA